MSSEPVGGRGSGVLKTKGFNNIKGLPALWQEAPRF